MFRPSAPPRRKTWTSTLSDPTAASATRVSSDEGSAPTPTTARPAPLRKTRREMSQVTTSPPLHLRAGEDEAGDLGDDAGPAGARAARGVQRAPGQAVSED